MRIELLGTLAVTAMLVTYALERRAAVYVLAFAAACATASVYAVLIRSWPFAIVEAIWAIVAFRRWQLRRSQSVRAARGG